MLRRSPLTRNLAITASSLVVLGLVLVSPLWLRSLSNIPGLNWGQLSNIGQTYGAVSAILSALALIGVSISVLLQLNEVRFNRLQERRTRHYELVRFMVENPAYLNIIEPSPSGSSTKARQASAFINLWLQYWQLLWEFSDISERELHAQAHSLFTGEAGRNYWQQSGQARLQNANTAKELEFDKLIDSAYQDVIATRIPVWRNLDSDPKPQKERVFDFHKPAWFVITFTLGMLFKRLVSKSLRESVGLLSHRLTNEGYSASRDVMRSLFLSAACHHKRMACS